MLFVKVDCDWGEKISKIEKATIVHTSIENIFSYISEPNNWLEFWPNLMEIADVQSLPNGGYSSQWAYKMLGMTFQGTAKCTEMVANQWLVIETMGGIGSTITWTFRSKEDITRMTLTIEYKVPIPLLGKLAEAIIVDMNNQEADAIMYYLQAKFIKSNL